MSRSIYNVHVTSPSWDYGYALTRALCHIIIAVRKRCVSLELLNYHAKSCHLLRIYKQDAHREQKEIKS